MAGGFQTTSWSTILAAQDREGEGGQEALNQLCVSYWPPIYAFFRRKGYPEEDASDLTQELFAHLLSRDFPTNLSRSGGRFRSFLLVCAQNLARDSWERDNSQKRGAGRLRVTFDPKWVEDHFSGPPPAPVDPREHFDQMWAETLLRNVLDRMRVELAESGRGVLFEHLRDCLVTGGKRERYAVLGAAIGMSEGAVKVAVHRMRKRFAELLREEIAQTVQQPEDVDAELRYLVEISGR